MVNSKTFDLTENAFGDLAIEVFSGTDESQEGKNILPPEMLEKIFKLLNYKEIFLSKQVCKRWKMIIVKFKLLEKASGEIF